MVLNVKIHGCSYSGKLTSIVAKFDDNGKLLNPRSLAQTSMIGWGKWQQAHKVKCKFGDCWWVSTAGHGGYVLVTQTPLPFDFPTELSNTTPDSTFYVYQFEEDCNWAVLEYFDEGVYNPKEKALSTFDRFLSKEQRRQCVEQTMIRWNPSLYSAKQKKEIIQ